MNKNLDSHTAYLGEARDRIMLEDKERSLQRQLEKHVTLIDNILA